MEEKDKLNKIIDEAKILLNIFEQIKEKADTNNQCLFLKYMDRVTIGRMIVPYLDIKDILEFRFTCKDINAAVSSTVSLVSYYKAVSKKKQAQPVPNENIFKAFNELNDGEDIQMQLESLRQVHIS